MAPAPAATEEPCLDAYVFASSATPAAIEALKAGVAAGGPARVVCPLDGPLKLYVAVAAPDEAALREKLDAVLATEGLHGADEYVATTSWGDGSSFPTHVMVDVYVGFAVIEGGATTAALGGLSAAGAAVATDGTVILELTGDNQARLRQVLNALPGAATGVGATADGAGFRTA